MIGRALGLDIGDVRIGVALSDPMGVIASPLTAIAIAKVADPAQAVCDLAREHEAQHIVAGMPLTNKGEEGHQAEKVRVFLDKLRAMTDLPIETIDERYTSVIAERALRDMGGRRKKPKGAVDALAAQQILQTWLERRGRSGPAT